MCVHYLCLKIFKEVNMKNEYVIRKLRRIFGDKEFLPKNPNEICQKILHTAFLGCDEADDNAKKRSQALADKIGSNHMSTDFSSIFNAFREWIKNNDLVEPNKISEGGSLKEDVILSNLR